MFVEDLDLLVDGGKSLQFRAMIVPLLMDVRMITVKLIPVGGGADTAATNQYAFCDVATGEIYSRPTSDLQWNHPHHMEIVSQDWKAFQRRLRILRIFFRWFCEGLLEEVQLYPWLFSYVQ